MQAYRKVSVIKYKRYSNLPKIYSIAETPFNQNYSRQCNGSEKLTKDNGYVPEAQLQFVSDAVMAFGVALAVSIACHSGANPGGGDCGSVPPPPPPTPFFGGTPQTS